MTISQLRLVTEPTPEPDITILMPCLNEAATLAQCIVQAQAFLAKGTYSGEILIADNGSDDGSQKIADSMGCRVVPVDTRGYGAALIGGIRAAKASFVVMADADASYNFENIEPFIAELQAGADLVIGNRFKGGIGPHAMPFLHRYLGNPVLSWLGRLLFKIRCRDFHCGQRAFRRDAILALDLKTTGMEFASEMIVRAALDGLRIAEVPTTLVKDGRGRAPHLRTWQDGWRHLKFLLLYSPRWLFIYPGLALLAFGGGLSALLAAGRWQITAGLSLDIHAFLFASASLLLGTQSITFGLLARRYAVRSGLLPRKAGGRELIDFLTLERVLQIALLLLIPGAFGVFWAIFDWGRMNFGPMEYSRSLRLLILSLSAVSCAFQLILSGFLLSVIDTPQRRSR